MFRVLKSDLENQSFDSVTDAYSAVQQRFRLLSENKLKDQLEKLQEHCQRVVGTGRDYIPSVLLNFHISINIMAHSTQVTMFLGQSYITLAAVKGRWFAFWKC